jgi:hypothetical protein
MTSTETPRHAAQPETAAALDRMNEAAWEAADRELLELCHRRVASLLDGAEDPVGSRRLTEREQAFLAFTEQFVFSVAGTTDADVDALLAHAGPIDVYRFVAALYTLEMTMRIEIAARVALPAAEVTS